jgi:hypothetical protein
MAKPKTLVRNLSRGILRKYTLQNFYILKLHHTGEVLDNSNIRIRMLSAAVKCVNVRRVNNALKRIAKIECAGIVQQLQFLSHQTTRPAVPNTHFQVSAWRKFL